MKTHKLAGENFQLEIPSNWRLEKIKSNKYQIDPKNTASFNIVTEDGRRLAELRTGGEEIWDLIPFPNMAENTLFDAETDSQGGWNHYAFISYEGKPNQAEMMLTAVDPKVAKGWGNNLEGLIYSGGSGAFIASIDNTSKLPGVPDTLKGAERFKAYAKTDEYVQLKKAMLSFKQITSAASSSGAPANEACVGAKYAYELGDSGLSCAEAKSFLSKILQQPIHTGAAEILGEGACLLAFDENPGHCNIDKTGGTFTYAAR